MLVVEMVVQFDDAVVAVVVRRAVGREVADGSGQALGGGGVQQFVQVQAERARRLAECLQEAEGFGFRDVFSS